MPTSVGAAANVGLLLSTTVYNRIVSWYEEDNNDPAGSLLSAPAPSVSTVIKTEPRPYFYVVIVENSVLLAAAIALTVAYLIYYKRRQARMGKTEEQFKNPLQSTQNKVST